MSGDKLTEKEIAAIFVKAIRDQHGQSLVGVVPRASKEAAHTIAARLAERKELFEKKNEWLLSILKPRFMPCGHERRFIYPIDGGTKYCVVCEAESLLEENKQLRKENEHLRWMGRMLLHMLRRRVE